MSVNGDGVCFEVGVWYGWRVKSKNPDIERKLWGAIKKSEGFSAF